MATPTNVRRIALSFPVAPAELTNTPKRKPGKP
jgi:hypothetical protein